MPVANVSAALMPDGELYGYICGDGCLWRYHANPTRSGVRTELKTTQAAPAADRPVQVLVGPDEGGRPSRHLFYRKPRTNEVWYGVDSAPDGPHGLLDVRRVASATESVWVMKTFGAVATSTGVILVGAAPDSSRSTVQIAAIPWSGLSRETWLEGMTLDVVALPIADDDSAEFDAEDSEVSCDVLVHPVTGDRHLVIVAKRRTKTLDHLGCWSALLTDDLRVGTLVQDPKIWTEKAIRFPVVQVLPDNQVAAYFLDHNGKAQCWSDSPLDLLGDPSSQQHRGDWGNGEQTLGLGIIAKMSKGAARGVNYGGNAFRLVFAFGQATEKPSPNNPDLTDATVPMRAGVLYYNGAGTIAEMYDASSWGALVRSGRPLARGASMLLGIMEGPPPIPNENLNIADKYDPLLWFGQPGYSAATFTGTTNHENVTELNAKASFIGMAEFKGRVGIDFQLFGAKSFLKWRTEFGIGVTLAHRSVSSKERVTAITALGEIQGGDGKTPYSVQPSGVLVIQEAFWTGYSYSYSRSGSKQQGSYIVHEIKPVHINLVVQPYLMNSSSCPRPGELTSYFRGPEEERALEHDSIIEVGDGTGYLTGGWAYDAKHQPSFATLDESSLGAGFAASVKTMLSTGGKVDFFGSGGETEVGVGAEITIGGTWTNKVTNKISVGGEVILRGNPEAPMSYLSYSYRMFLLKPDKMRTKALLDSLVTDTFPVHPADRQRQLALRDSIDTDSTAWTLCYAVDRSSVIFNNAAGESAEPPTS